MEFHLGSRLPDCRALRETDTWSQIESNSLKVISGSHPAFTVCLEIVHLSPTSANTSSPNAGYGYAFTAHNAFALPNALTAPNAFAPHNAFGPNVITTLSVMFTVCHVIVHILMAFFLSVHVADDPITT